MKKEIILFSAIIISMNLMGQQLLQESSLHLNSGIKSNHLLNQDLFNYNCVLSPGFIKETDFSNKIDNNSTLFIAFSSDANTEKAMLDITAGKTVICISNKGISNSEFVPFNKVDAHDGIILCYQFNSRKTKKNNLLSLKKYKEDTVQPGNRLLELIYFPRLLETTDREIVESYLSIKYGISLIDSSNYVNAAGDTIWHYDLNEGFNNNITGIGRDDSINLYQPQSYNSKFKGLTIGVNSLSNNNFLLWGDNNGTLELKQQDNVQIESIERKWKIRMFGIDSIQTTIQFDSAYFRMEESKNSTFWLVKSNSDVLPFIESEFVKQDTLASDKIVFSNVNFGNNSDTADYFSILRTPDFFALHRLDSTCHSFNKWSLDLKMLGGESPYLIKLSGHEDKFIESDSALIRIDDLAAGIYNIGIKDKRNKIFNEIIEIKDANNSQPYLEEQWLIGETGYVDVEPVTNDNLNYNYHWYKDEQLISEEPRCRISDEGSYCLKLSNNNCYTNYNFTVSTQSEEVVVFPNPVSINKPFTIIIKLADIADIDILISDMNGKLVREIRRNGIRYTDITEKLSHPGKYLINVRVNNKNFVRKLIVI